MDAVPLVQVIRAGLEESVHVGDVAVVDASGRLLASAGDPGRRLYARSSMKPLQASVSLSFAPFEFTDAEVSVMCASHNAEPVHVATVRSLLARAGVPEDALQTPSVRPWDEETLAADPERRRINSDCSGKHGGMLAACRAQEWPLETYREREHPLQSAVLSAVLRASAQDAVHVGVDGCGVPVHGMPLAAMATIYARLADAERLGDLEPLARRATAAMQAEPYLVAGRNRPDTAIMQVARDVIVKGGAEGLMCAALLGAGIGVAVKIRDGGGGRATGPAMIRALRSLDVLADADVDSLALFAAPPVLGGGRQVGELRAAFTLDRI
jgi:L-asparaginase II